MAKRFRFSGNVRRRVGAVLLWRAGPGAVAGAVDGRGPRSAHRGTSSTPRGGRSRVGSFLTARPFCVCRRLIYRASPLRINELPCER